MGAGIRDRVELPTQHNSEYPVYNVVMFGFDSMSRNAVIRKLPRTYEHLIKNMKAIVLNGYNIVGDGTPQALIPILTGYTELELPETSKKISDSASVDVYPMIWKDYKKHGYVTSFNEDLPDYSTFTYRMNGFRQQPTDHYLRTFYVEEKNILATQKRYCIGNQPGHKIMLDYTKNFLSKYTDKPRFVFSFHGELSHDSINDIGIADDDLVIWLKEMQEEHLLDNTIFIFMSDHGNRFSDVRNTLQGKQEERMPFFSFAFPESFRNRFALQYETFIENSHRLTTPFDIHATLMDILRLQSLPIQQPTEKIDYKTSLPPYPGRGISLFEPIPKNRSCAAAYIEPHWCACLNWEQIDVKNNSLLIKQLAQSVLNTINDFTKEYRNICELLELNEVNWAMKIKPHTELIKFKQNKDTEGFVGDFSSKMKVQKEIYQIQIVTNPGKSIFEASVTHSFPEYEARLSQISRINKYGTQANCIYDVNPELRKYCYCRS